MEALLIYFLKMIVFSSLMFGYYFVFLKDKTFHHYNRFYLLSIVVVSILLPLIRVEYFTIEVNPDIYLLLNNFNVVQPKNINTNDFNIFSLAFIFVGLVSVFFIVKFLIGLIKIQKLKKQFSKMEFEGINFYETPLEDAPFSYFKNLFWKDSIPLQSDIGKQILKHEMVHIEQKHTWDKILISTVLSLFWFNPIFYFLKREIALIHEYLADKKAIKQSDTKAFAQMLLQTHFTGNTLPATSPFLSSNLKKRLIMLKKSHTKYSYARKILALPLVFALGFAFLVNAKNREISKTNIEIAEAVSQIKKDTIKDKNVAIAVYNGAKSFEEIIINASDTTPFIIGEKRVTKAEYLKYYYQNKDSKTLSFSVDYKEGTEIPKAFGTIDLNDKENVAFGRAYDEKLDGKFNPNQNLITPLLAASYAPKGLKLSYSENARKSTNKDQFYFNYKKISRADFLKLMNNDAGKSDYYFGYIESVDNNKIFSAIDDINLQLPDEFFNALDKKNSNKATYKSGNYTGKTVYVEDDQTIKNLDNPLIQKPISKNKEKFEKASEDFNDTVSENKEMKIRQKDNPWIISVGAHAVNSTMVQEPGYYLNNKEISKKAFNELDVNQIASVNVVKEKDAKGSGKIYIATKNAKEIEGTAEYNKIYINGKLSTQADLNKIDRKKITSENIKKNNDNGEIYNEIRIRTKR